MIQVRDIGDGNYAVIDGMHRVTALQELKHEKHIGIDYDKVRHYHAIVLFNRHGHPFSHPSLS
jgi:hypothetical protein